MGAPKRTFRARLPPILTLSTRYQTGWNVTKCHACHLKRRDNLLGNIRKGHVFQLPPIDTATPQANQRLETRHVDAENQHFVRDFLQFWHFWHIIKQVGMSQSASPATQNDMTTSLETFKKERFCGFPQRHGEFTGTPGTRDETSGSTKTIISYDTSGDFHSWQHDKRTSFAASPIDMARPRENQRPQTRQVGAPKRIFRARFPPIFTFCSCKIDVFLRVFLRTWKFATSKSMFRARLPSIFSTSHKMPRLPRNLHLVTTWRSPANAIYKKHAKGHV